MAKQKKKLTRQEEFDIMKLVLDKFLWLGFAIMTYGLFVMSQQEIADGFAYMIAGAIVLIIFLVLMIREYEYIK